MTRVTKHGSKNLYWSFGATFVLHTFLYVGSFLVKTGGVLMLHLELWMIREDDQGTQHGSKHHYWSFGATFVLQTFFHLGSILVKIVGVLMLHLEFWMIGEDDQGDPTCFQTSLQSSW